MIDAKVFIGRRTSEKREEMKTMKKGRGTKGLKGIQRTQQRVVKQTQAQELPVNDAPSNASGDRLALLSFGGLVAAAALVLGFGSYYSIHNFITAVSAEPVDVWTCVVMVLILVTSFMVARMLYWLSFFGSVMLATRTGAWSMGETICKKAIRFHKLVPNGSGWASVALVQSLIGRGQFEDAVSYAESEWERNGENSRQVLNLGPMCVAAGMAQQATGNIKQASLWNDRGISALTRILEQADAKGGGLFARAARMQASQWTGQVKMQLAVAHFHSATFHFNNQDFRRAKENFKKSVDYANQSPDFPQKQDVIKMARDQLARLKHH